MQSFTYHVGLGLAVVFPSEALSVAVAGGRRRLQVRGKSVLDSGGHCGGCVSVVEVVGRELWWGRKSQERVTLQKEGRIHTLTKFVRRE